MPFQVTRSLVLKICADQVEALITRPYLRNRQSTVENLHAYLVYLGLDYSPAEVQLIVKELRTRGVLQDVPA